MTCHPKDLRSHNPRIQCDACGKWMRQFAINEDGSLRVNYYGGCEITNGDHPGNRDICIDCHPKACTDALGEPAKAEGSR